jgi:hypothetical protein
MRKEVSCQWEAENMPLERRPCPVDWTKADLEQWLGANPNKGGDNILFLKEKITKHHNTAH